MPKSFSTATIALVTFCIAWLRSETGLLVGMLFGGVVGRPEMMPEGRVGIGTFVGGEMGNMEKGGIEKGGCVGSGEKEGGDRGAKEEGSCVGGGGGDSKLISVVGGGLKDKRGSVGSSGPKEGSSVGTSGPIEEGSSVGSGRGGNMLLILGGLIFESPGTL